MTNRTINGQLILIKQHFFITAALLIISSLITANAHAAACSNPASDPDGDGWGYENGQSCTTQVIAAPSGECIDPDGDGYGWDGQQSCITSNAPSTAGNCIDHDGDGWGWNGIASCQTSTPAVTPTPQPTVTVQSTPTTQTNTASCTSTISTANELYNAVAKGAGKICLRSGSYGLSKQLALRSNQTLSALTPTNPPVLNIQAVRSVTTTAQSNIKLENLILDGNSKGALEFAILIGKGSRNVTLNNVTVRNTVGIGIGITGAHNITVKGGSVQNIGLDTRLRQAIWVTFGSSNVTIDGVYVRGRENDKAGGDHAITCIDSVNGYTVTNVRSEFAGSGAIAANNCSNIVMTNNTISNGREFGIDIVNGAMGAVVTGNKITGFARAAMVFDDHSWKCGGCGSNPSEIIVRNNQMQNNNRVSLSRCKGIAVDKQMVINPNANQQQNSDWVKIDNSNTIDADSPLYCEHNH